MTCIDVTHVMSFNSIISGVSEKRAFVPQFVILGCRITFDTDVNLECLMNFGDKQRLILTFNN